MHRRAFLTAVGVGVTTGLAGCGGQDGGTSTPAGSGGDGSTATPSQTPGPEPSGSTPASGSGSTAEPASTDESGSSGAPALAEVQMQPETDYRFRIDARSAAEGAGAVVMEGSWNDGDYHATMTGDGQNVDTYYVDGTSYYESGGECVSASSGDQGTGVDAQQWADTDETTSDLEDVPSLVATGTTTIDGERMHVFELTPEEHDVETTVTYYVSAETGYFRRLESEGFVVDYWDWGATDPIQAPC